MYPQTELLDAFTESEIPDVVDVALPSSTTDPTIIGFKDATFQWMARDGARPARGDATPSSGDFQLVVEGELYFKRGKINLIVGPTGSGAQTDARGLHREMMNTCAPESLGKTSLLLALLGEMYLKQGAVSSFFNLPRDGGVAFCAQESWVQNASVKVKSIALPGCIGQTISWTLSRKTFSSGPPTMKADIAKVTRLRRST